MDNLLTKISLTKFFFTKISYMNFFVKRIFYLRIFGSSAMTEAMKIQKTTEEPNTVLQTIHATGSPYTETTGASASSNQGAVAKALNLLESKE